MSDFAGFLQRLLFEGRILLGTPPDARPAPDALPILTRAYAAHRLEVAGPTLEFDAEVAIAAGRLVWRAAWFLLESATPSARVGQVLCMPLTPSRPDQHLSADLILRLLPGLQRRARAFLPQDVLPEALAEVLRRWPLSGVLSELAEPPLTPPEFGHDGLALLYAERLARHERPAWFPESMAAVELVWQDLGRPTDGLRHLHELARELADKDPA